MTSLWLFIFSLLAPESASWIRICKSELRIRILLSSSKNGKKTLIPTVLRHLFDLLSLKNDVNAPSKSNMQENFFINLFVVGVLKVNDENSRIPIRIHLSEAWIRGSGSVLKCHGSATATLVYMGSADVFSWNQWLWRPEEKEVLPKKPIF